MSLKVVSIVFNNFLNDSRVLKEVSSLKNNGYDVSVIALHEEGLKEVEDINGVIVNRISLRSRRLPKNLIVQIIKYIELCTKIIKILKNNVDIIHCNDILPLPISVWIKKLSKRKVKIVYDAHELQTETQKLVNKPIRKKLVKIVEKRYIKFVDKVITVSEGIASYYEDKYKIEKPTLVLNCPEKKQVNSSNLFRKKFNIPHDEIIFIYQGAIEKGRGVDILIDTFKKIEKTKAHLVIMGMGTLVSKIKEYEDAYSNIHYHEPVPPHEIINFTSSADIGLCLIENTCLNYYYSLPNKLFEYTMSGLPIIVNNLPEMKKIVQEYNVGWVISDLNERELEKLVKNILKEDLNKYIYNTSFVKEKYNWNNQEKMLLELYDSLK